jgi:hypothetical protein
MQEQGSRIHVAEITVVPQLNQGVPEKLLDIFFGVLFGPACRQAGSIWTGKRNKGI